MIPEDAIKPATAQLHNRNGSRIQGKTNAKAFACLHTPTGARTLKHLEDTDVLICSISCSDVGHCSCLEISLFWLLLLCAFLCQQTAGSLWTGYYQPRHKTQMGGFIIAGDFNLFNFGTILPEFPQYVSFPTRGKNTLQPVYSSITDAYKASPPPHLGQSDHISLLLTPVYRPLINRVRPSIRTVQIWPEGALSQLQDCLKSTEGSIFSTATVQPSQPADASLVEEHNRSFVNFETTSSAQPTATDQSFTPQTHDLNQVFCSATSRNSTDCCTQTLRDCHHRSSSKEISHFVPQGLPFILLHSSWLWLVQTHILYSLFQPLSIRNYMRTMPTDPQWTESQSLIPFTYHIMKWYTRQALQRVIISTQAVITAQLPPLNSSRWLRRDTNYLHRPYTPMSAPSQSPALWTVLLYVCTRGPRCQNEELPKSNKPPEPRHFRLQDYKILFYMSIWMHTGY